MYAIRSYYETFVLETAPRENSAIHSLDGATFTAIDETTLEVTKLQTLSMTSVFDHLKEQAVTVESIRSKHNRLEELFMEIVITSYSIHYTKLYE